MGETNLSKRSKTSFGGKSVNLWRYLLAHMSPKAQVSYCYRSSSVRRPSSSGVNIFKHLLLRSRWANCYQTWQLWSLGHALSDLLKWRCHVIQDGRRGKVGQILKKSSSHEPPGRFRRNLVWMIDSYRCFRFVHMVAPGSKMGVARGVK